MARNNGDGKSTRSSSARGKGGNDISDVFQLVKEYIRQETVGPLKGIGRFIAFGIAGAVLLSLGLVLLLLAGLRALQTETGTAFDENLSWLPYLFVVFGVAIVIVIALSRISKTGLSRSEDEQR